MSIYDCFMYFDEDVMLDLRLHTLDEYIDTFVIAEATRDHAGNEKKLNFDYKNFLKFKDKIKYLVIDDLPTKVKSVKKNWAPDHLRDQHQRNSLAKGFENCDDNDLIMISDIDEIPDPNVLDMELRVNGKVHQKAKTGEMIYKTKQMVSWWSNISLEPGDLITSGSPPGVIAGWENP